jgi:hypothetical protein
MNTSSSSGSLTTGGEIKEKLAAIEHERWADWQKWCHQVLRDQLPPSDELEAVLRRWDRQIETPYSQLSSKEKASDMEQVDRYWPLIEAEIQKQMVAARIAELSWCNNNATTVVYKDDFKHGFAIPVSTINDRIALLHQQGRGE